MVGHIASGIDEYDERMLLLRHSFEMGQSFLGELCIGIHGRQTSIQHKQHALAGMHSAPRFFRKVTRRIAGVFQTKPNRLEFSRALLSPTP